jgi:hypothetical protein
MPFLWPFDTKAVGQFQRVDQGWDLQDKAGGAVHAVSSGVIGRASADPGGFGNDYPYEVLDASPAGAPSDTLYYGHVHVNPALIGQHVLAGQVIATTSTVAGQNGSAAPPGWLEIGFARHASGGPAPGGGSFIRSLLQSVTGGTTAPAAASTATAVDVSTGSGILAGLGSSLTRLAGEAVLLTGGVALAVLGVYKSSHRSQP